MISRNSSRFVFFFRLLYSISLKLSCFIPSAPFPLFYHIFYHFGGLNQRFLNNADLEKYLAGDKEIGVHSVRRTVEHAAYLMGKSVKFVQQGLQQIVLPIGAAVELGHYVWDYYISPKLFSDYTGIVLNQND